MKQVVVSEIGGCWREYWLLGRLVVVGETGGCWRDRWLLVRQVVVGEICVF